MSFLRQIRECVFLIAREFLEYPEITLNLVDVDLGKSVHVSSDQGIYAYDAYFVVCAQKLHAPLLSLDKGLKEAAKQAGIKLLEVA